MDYLDELNNEQKQAVTSHEQYLRVIAGAGSGKTKVLTHRIAYLINELGVPDFTILAITFTNKAAKEMKERVQKLLAGISCRTSVSTFHSFCARLLREDIKVLGYPPSFVIVDEDDQKKIIKQIMKDKVLDDEKTFKPSELLSYISNKKNEELSPSRAKASADGYYGEQIKASVYEAYEEYLAKNHYLDFDDLLLKAVEVLSDYKEIREKWQRRITNILVDEFQDTNNLQYRLIKLLCNENTSLFVVGDPDQTIYTWRGANVDIIMNFKTDYKNVEDIILKTNYRSTSNILNCANALIANNKDRVPKDLVTDNPEGGAVLYFEGETVNHEATWVVERILELMNKNGNLTYSDFAVLYRSNYYSRSMENVLVKMGVPYVVYGSLKFYDRKEIKDSLCYLRLAVNPNDEIAFERIINEPRRGVGDKSLGEIHALARETHTFLYEAFKNSDIKIRHSKEVESFFAAMEKAKQAILDKQLTYSDILQNLLDEANYIKDIEEKKETERIENIDEFKLALDEMQKEDPTRELADILQEIALYAAQDEINDDKHRVSLMTIHTAKGLEFPYVFVIGLNEGVLPNFRALEESRRGIEEERRLAYVAFTRAQKQLFLTNSAGYNYMLNANQDPSRFLGEAGEFITSYYNTTRYKSNLKKKVAPKRTIVAAKPNNEDWHPGDLLIHTVFGEGIIISMDNDTLTVAFKDVKNGQKIISKSFGGIKKKV